jgi:hypothetical protein
MNKSALSVTEAELRADRNVGQINTLEIAIVGDNFYTVQFQIGAQVWTVRVRSITDAPALSILIQGALSEGCVHVCMGAQSHFHEATVAVGIQFSLLASSRVPNRPGEIADGQGRRTRRERWSSGRSCISTKPL